MPHPLKRALNRLPVVQGIWKASSALAKPTTVLLDLVAFTWTMFHLTKHEADVDSTLAHPTTIPWFCNMRRSEWSFVGFCIV